MLKLNSLRSLILSAVPSLKADPHRLMLWAPKGKIAATATEPLSFAYRYDINVMVTGFNQHIDSLMVPVLAWHKTHQPDRYENPRTQDAAFEFEAQLADPKKGDALDIWLGIPITESVRVLQQPGKPREFRVHHFAEGHAAPAPEQAERWEVWLETPEGPALKIGDWEGPDGTPYNNARRTVDALLG